MNFNSDHPFCDGRFSRLLEASGLLTPESGWNPFYIEEGDSLLPGFIKSHSYGEYIFDWAWAEYYQQIGLNYYPKIVHALPFTPVNAPKVIGHEIDKVLDKSKKFYLEHEHISSQHYLFTTKEENRWLLDNGYLLKETMQYHFVNKYKNFEDFLSTLKTRKRKNIKKERRSVTESNIQIVWKSGSEIDPNLMNDVFKLYLSTISKKQSYAYLNKAFFDLIPDFMDESLKIVLAYKDEDLIAMSLFISGKDCLYGRYWGIDPLFEAEFPFLHFELCYYQGMEFCFENSIPLFEAGAQGEHKLLRGFKPVVISSCHHLRDPSIHQAIKNHLVDHNAHNTETMIRLNEHLPFK